jgi:hypothetical protein
MKNYYVFLVKQWFDAKNGNTYHSVEYHDPVTGKTISSGRVYGYGDHYKQTAYAMMVKHGYSTDPSPRDFWKNNSIHYHVVEVPRKKDLNGSDFSSN